MSTIVVPEQPQKNYREYVGMPLYLLEQAEWKCGTVKGWFFNLAQVVLRLLAIVMLRPRREPTGNLDQQEVDSVYSREAKTYDMKHHLTTRGMDTMWRRMAGWCVANIARNNNRYVSVLDLCTGTGLAVAEMIPILSAWGIRADIVGLDYNVNMLKVARRRRLNQPGFNVRFDRGDAANLTHSEDVSVSDGLAHYLPETFDAVTQVFGIGGVKEPIRVFHEVLALLKPGGQFFLVDMHRPIPELSGEWPFCFRWISSPIFEALTYEKSTLPLVLNRLWAWRDTTMDFYRVPLVTAQDGRGLWWGFKILFFTVESERWWLGLPIMPVAKILLQKETIEPEEAFRRQETLLSL